MGLLVKNRILEPVILERDTSRMYQKPTMLSLYVLV